MGISQAAATGAGATPAIPRGKAEQPEPPRHGHRAEGSLNGGNMKKDVKKLATASVLAAITIVLGLTPLGIIPIPPANMSILCLPVIIGTLTCGLGTGMILGGIFGITSVIKAFTEPSVLVAPLLGSSPVFVIIMSLGARLLIPVVVYYVHRGMTRKGGMKKTGIGVSALLGSLTNTVCYLGLMLLFYVLAGLDSAAVLATVAGAGALNGSLEAVAAVAVSIPVVMAVNKSRRA